jgi:hypothetical protein
VLSAARVRAGVDAVRGSGAAAAHDPAQREIRLVSPRGGVAGVVAADLDANRELDPEEDARRNQYARDADRARDRVRAQRRKKRVDRVLDADA